MPLEKPPQPRTSARIAELADQCVQCGLCLPACPTYTLDGSEAESPRGRIAIAAALARGDVEPTAALREHLDHCLGCLNCEKICPAHVQYDELLIETRSLLGPSPRRPTGLLKLIRQPRRMRLLRHVARWIATPGLKRRLARRLPAHSAWRAALQLLPDSTPGKPVQARRASTGQPRVALFPGCIASIEDVDAQQATILLLQAAGFIVDVLPAFCCGALDLHGGMPEAAEQSASRVRQAWQASGASTLLSVTPGCLGTLRRALPDVRVIDPIELLAKHDSQLAFRPLSLSVALHLPCTQINVADTEKALRQLLHRVPGLDVQPLARPPHCCGAAGSHVLEYPQRARQLRDATLRQVTTLAPQRLLSSNIGCRLHLASGTTLPTQHPLTLLAEQLIPATEPVDGD